MLLTLRQQLSRFSHLLQEELYPVLEAETGELSETGRRLAAILEMIPLGRFIPSSQGWNGRPQRDPMPSRALSSPRRFTIFPQPAICWNVCAAMSNCG